MVQHLERPPGRNDPCPCGSGKKYKRCCLLTESAQRPARSFDDVLAKVYAADELGDSVGALQTLEEGRLLLRHSDLDRMLVDRLLELPPEEGETALRGWWNTEHDRFSGAGLAQLLILQGHATQALEVLTGSRSADAPPEYWRLLAQLKDEGGHPEAAVAALEMYARMAPGDAEAWITLADLQSRQGQTERALLSLRRASDAAPERLTPRMLRVHLLTEEGRWREARDLAESLVDGEYEDDKEETRRELKDVLAQAYFVLGDFDSARAIWSDLLERDPSDVELRYRLANLEAAADRPRRALLVLGDQEGEVDEPRSLDIQLRCLLSLDEYLEAEVVAEKLERREPGALLLPLVRAAQATYAGDHAWALEYLQDPPPDRYGSLWHSLRLCSLASLGRWNEVLPELKAIETPDDRVLLSAALGAMSTGRLDLADRLVAAMEDQGSNEARSLSALLGPLRQQRRADEVRRQQQVDQAEKQRRALENRDLRRQVHELERENALLSDAFAESEETVKRMAQKLGMEHGTTDWESWLRDVGIRAQRDAVARERRLAESTLRSLLGTDCWEDLSESVRAALRDAEQAYSSDGDILDHGTVLMGYARGLESAFKEAIFRPAWERWQHQPGNVARLQDEMHDPSLGPFVRFLLHGSHLTLGSMAAALDRMGDERRTGVAIDLLRDTVRVDRHDERTLSDWRRTAERLSIAAEARNRPAHAAAVSEEELRSFRDLVLGIDGLLRSLAQFCL
jgi:cytochrome c-type biogenesis protein CcmH/NrfG